MQASNSDDTPVALGRGPRRYSETALDAPDDDHLLLKFHFLNCTATEGTHTGCAISSVNEGGAQPAGLILTNELLGLLGLLHSPNGATGILIAPLTGKDFVLLSSTDLPCTLPQTEVEGNIAGLFAPTSTRQATAKIIIRPVTSTKQEVTLILTLAGAVTVKISAYGIAGTAETEDNVTFEEAVEVD